MVYTFGGRDFSNIFWPKDKDMQEESTKEKVKKDWKAENPSGSDADFEKFWEALTVLLDVQER